MMCSDRCFRQTNFFQNISNLQFLIIKMIEKVQRYFECSLQRKTLILLWIVMICCSFHMWCFNFNQNQPITLDNNKSAENFKTDPVYGTNLTKKVITKVNGPNVIEKNQRRTKRLVNEIVNQIIGISYSDIPIIAERFSNMIIPKILGLVKNSGIIESISEHVSKDIVDNINVRVNEHFDEIEIRVEAFFKNFIRFYFHIWSMLGFGGSVVGIYGIHKGVPECLSFSVVFFYFSAVSEFLIMSEINIDFNVERKIFLMSELVRIDCWSDWIKSPIILVNFGFLFFIALLVYFAFVVKKCQIAMCVKKDVSKKINSDYNSRGSEIRL